MNIEGYTIPHDDKQYIGGEDGYFFTENNNKVYACVFDGVGYWRKKNIEVKDFVNQLTYFSVKSIENGHQKPEIILEDALNHVSKVGSTTAIFVVIDNQHNALIYQLGDAGLLALKGEQVILQTDPQQHQFNLPYQFGKNQDGSFHGDSPSEGLFYRMKLEEGYKLILGSDGLFDNLKINEIIKTVSESEGDIAEALCQKAYQKSKQTTEPVPFYQEAYREKLTDSLVVGGKQDDITCIVVEV